MQGWKKGQCPKSPLLETDHQSFHNRHSFKKKKIYILLTCFYYIPIWPFSKEGIYAAECQSSYKIFSWDTCIPFGVKGLKLLFIKLLYLIYSKLSAKENFRYQQLLLQLTKPKFFWLSTSTCKFNEFKMRIQ